MFLALLLQIAAPTSPSTAPSSNDVVLKDGDIVPDLRGCVDYVGRGDLQFVDETALYNPDDLLGRSIYRFRFLARRALVGHWFGAGRDLTMAAHSLRKSSRQDQLVFIGRNGEGERRWVGTAWIWRDRIGRPFTPIFGWAGSDSGPGWMPKAARLFARRVDYAWHQPYWPGVKFNPREDPGLIETRDGHARVLWGLYLADIPRMMQAARVERCWR